jgi:hypothetical protein
MAIGINRSAGYNYAGLVGTLNGIATTGAPVGNAIGQSVKLYLVTVKDVGTSAIDLQAFDDAVGELFEILIQAMPVQVLAYFAPADTSGTISVICDGVNAPAASVLQTAIRALGASVSANAVDVRGTTVADGTSFTVA